MKGGMEPVVLSSSRPPAPVPCSRRGWSRSPGAGGTHAGSGGVFPASELGRGPATLGHVRARFLLGLEVMKVKEVMKELP